MSVLCYTSHIYIDEVNYIITPFKWWSYYSRISWPSSSGLSCFSFSFCVCCAQRRLFFMCTWCPVHTLHQCQHSSCIFRIQSFLKCCVQMLWILAPPADTSIVTATTGRVRFGHSPYALAAAVDVYFVFGDSMLLLLKKAMKSLPASIMISIDDSTWARTYWVQPSKAPGLRWSVVSFQLSILVYKDDTIIESRTSQVPKR